MEKELKMLKASLKLKDEEVASLQEEKNRLDAQLKRHEHTIKVLQQNLNDQKKQNVDQ